MGTKLAELLDETRGVGFEEFLAHMEGAMAADTRPEAQRPLRFARAFMVVLVETARAEAGDDPSPEQWADTVMCAFGGIAWALPCFVASGVKQGATSAVVGHMLAEVFMPMLRDVAAHQDTAEEVEK
jgi:hypothetical protein